MKNETAIVLLDEFPHIPTLILQSAFEYYNALRDVGMGHSESLDKARLLIQEVSVSDPYGKVSL